VQQAQAAVEAAKPVIATAMAEAAKQTAALADAQRAESAAAAVVAAAKQQAIDKKAIADAVNEAFSKTELARQKLPGDSELAQAAQKLKARFDALTNDLKPLDAKVAEAVADDKQAADRVADAKSGADAAAAQLAAAQQKLTMAESAVKTAVEKATKDKITVETAIADLERRLSRRGAIAGLKPLSPEQLAWSMMQVVGQVDQQRAAAEAEWTKNFPPDAKPDPAKPPPDITAKAQAIEQSVYDKLNGNVGQFVSLFAAAPGQPQQDFSATVDQALFFANGGQVRGWLAAGGGNLAERLVKLDDAKALADELFLTVFTRHPTDDEVADVSRYLAARAKERPAAIQDVIWGLLSSAEFRFNH
jgi:hypothetical protein